MRIAAVVLLSVISSLQGFGQDKKPEVQLTTSLSGQEMFKTSCAVCHGTDGKGNGPAAGALKKMPADLTVLSKKNGGKFPTDRVRSYIDGRKDVEAHGSRDMPIWGTAFEAIGASTAAITYRVVTLATYIESLQVK